jgi:hypothetical protein
MMKLLRRALIGLAVLVTLVGLFYAEENFRGKRAWQKYRRELEARGDQVDWKTFIPKPIPDEQNFASIPLVQSWFSRTNDLLRRDVLSMSFRGKPARRAGALRTSSPGIWLSKLRAPAGQIVWITSGQENLISCRAPKSLRPFSANSSPTTPRLPNCVPGATDLIPGSR